MKRITVRPCWSDESKLLLERLTKIQDANLFDPDVLRYPATRVLCADDGEPLIYMPVQRVAMLESLAPRPETTPRQMALAISALVRDVARTVEQEGYGEIYFICQDEDVNRMAEKHGFERLKWPVLRLRIADLEKTHVPLENSATD